MSIPQAPDGYKWIKAGRWQELNSCTECEHIWDRSDYDPSNYLICANCGTICINGKIGRWHTYHPITKWYQFSRYDYRLVAEFKEN